MLLCLVLNIGVTFSQSRTRGSNSGPLVSQTPQWQAVLTEQPAPASTTLISSDVTSSTLRIEVPGFWMVPARLINGEMEFTISAEKGSPMLEKGCPDLSKLAVSLAIPDLNDMEVSIVSSAYTDFPGFHVAPSKGNIKRDVIPEEVPFEYGPSYEADAFYPGELVELRDPYIMREIRGEAVVFYPVQYNPVTKVLRVYHEIIVEVHAKPGMGKNPLLTLPPSDHSNREYQRIYEGYFANYTQYKSNVRYDPLEEDGNMLIISYGPFMTDMQPFVDWKISRGIPTEMVDVATIGDANAIKDYVQDYYDTNGLTYLLLVGDAAQVPTYMTVEGASDNSYGYVAGDDHYPDIFVGRFSAQTSAHVQTQVQRTIDYEKNATVSSSHYDRSICIGSDYGPGDDGEFDWQHQRNMRTDEVNYNYTYSAELYDGSQGGADVSGDPTISMVSSEINTGAGLITYTGHGNTSTWGTSGFSSGSISSYLNNTGKLPVVISVACLNGNFTNATCFAEYWLRSTLNGDPKGAAAVIMSTINQAWNPPMDGQDEMIDILTESYANNIKRTFGGVCMNGCMKMNDTYGASGEVETDTWTIFGDPSLLLRTKVPEFMNVVHDQFLPLGTSQLMVDCSKDGAQVVVADGNVILGSATVSNGSVTFQFPPVNLQDTFQITATAYNTTTYEGTVVFSDASMTYLNSESFQNNFHGVAPGENNADIIGIKVITTGTNSPLTVNTLKVNLNGTTDITDISQLKVYYTGLDPVFHSDSLFATAQPSSNTISITGNQQLKGGVNYFWLSADVISNAPIGNLIDAECIRVVISNSQKTPSVTAPAGNREIDIMQLDSIAIANIGSGYTTAGVQNLQMARINVSTTGDPDPLNLQSMVFDLSGTTNLLDIQDVKIYFSGSQDVFTSNATYLGQFAPVSGPVTFNHTVILSEGSNYFWALFDLSSSAFPGNVLDMSCDSVTIDSIVHIIAVPNPEGVKIIEATYCTPQYSYGTSSGDYISLVSLEGFSNTTGASATPFYTVYENIPPQLTVGQDYSLTVSAGTYSSGNTIAAWIDYNQDGQFSSWEKLGQVNVGAKPTTAVIPFSVPDSAHFGVLRMRVRETFNTPNMDPCQMYYYGEAEDYRVEIYTDGLWLGNNNEWNDPSNWLSGQVPDENTTVVIPAGLAGGNLPTVFSGSSPECKDLHIGNGINLVIPTGTVFTIHGMVN